MTPKPSVGPKAAQIRGGAGAALAEAEIGADDDMRQAEPVGSTSRAKASGVSAARPASNGSSYSRSTPSLASRLARASAFISRNGGASGAKNCARMRLEGDHAQRRVGRGLRAGEVDHRLMAQMHAVEIADGGRGAAVRRPSDRSRISVFACAWPGRPGPVQSNLRLGARTSASPFSTTVSPTDAAAVKRHPAPGVVDADHLTSARTTSPGRTGARNLSVWPR